MAWFSLAKIALQAGSKIYANRQKTKMAMSDAQLMHAEKMARGEEAYQGKLLEARQNDYKDEFVLVIISAPIIVLMWAVMSDDPLPEPFDELPTAVSQGYDVTGYNWRGFYTGGEVSDEDYASMVEDLETLYASDEWKDVAAQNGLVPLWRGGDDFSSFVEESIQRVEAISREIGVIQ